MADAQHQLDYASPPNGDPKRYFEKRIDGTRTFELNGGRVHIKGKNSLRADFELTIDLASVSPTYSLLRVRHRLFFYGLFVLIAALFATAVTQKMAVLIGSVIAALIIIAVSWRKQTFFQFQYRTGGVAFDVCEAGPQKAHAAEFVKAVVSAIPTSAPHPAAG